MSVGRTGLFCFKNREFDRIVSDLFPINLLCDPMGSMAPWEAWPLGGAQMLYEDWLVWLSELSADL